MSTSIPALPEQLTTQFLTEMISDNYPGTQVSSVHITDSKGFGEGAVATSGRVMLDLEYDANPAKLTHKVVVKMARGDQSWTGKLFEIYENEVLFYKKIRPELNIEAPEYFGGIFSKDTSQYVLALADLNEKNVYFPSQLDMVTIEHMQKLLDMYARMHAKFWESPRLHGDLHWVKNLHEESMWEVFSGIVREGVKQELRLHKFKVELLERLGTSEEQLFEDQFTLLRHQSTLPQTILHGDSHYGNTYRLPDNTPGLYDWQVWARGYVMHDITYIINSSLSIKQRRKHEYDLIAYYRDRLGSYGVSNLPSLDELWSEHCMASHWNFHIGWLACPSENYGWDLLTVALQRASTAYEDHDTKNRIAQLR